MKKNILAILMLAPILGFVAACKKSQFSDRFVNPEKTTNGTIDGLYTGLFNNRRIVPDYWNLYTFVTGQLATYTQTLGIVTVNKMYEQPAGFAEDRWDDFYASPGNNWTGPLANYREIEKLYNELPSDAEKTGYLLFLETSRIFLYDYTAQQVDLWGDIPFSEAGSLNASGVVKPAAYDNAGALYDTALNNLVRISNYLATVQPEQYYLNKLAKQDVLFKGDLLKWRRYANSLILRLAMRISYQDENKAKALVQQILSNPTLYPVIDGIDNNVQITTGPPNLTTDLTSSFIQGHDVAPGYLVDSLWKPSGDPRLRLIFTLNKNGVYQGLSTTTPAATQQTQISDNLVSRLDTVTFIRNSNFPGIIFTAAEVSFLKAEAYERWGGGTAKTAYEQGIQYSIAYWYKIHTGSSYTGTRETAPTPAEITLLLANPLVAYGTGADNLRKIATQKWADFGMMQNIQGWAELRRTGFPKLTFAPDPGVTAAATPAYRLMYPSKERSLNSDNYAKVADKDQLYAKIFWMK